MAADPGDAPAARNAGSRGDKGKIDYKERLNAEEFATYVRLRDLRKTLLRRDVGAGDGGAQVPRPETVSRSWAQRASEARTQGASIAVTIGATGDDAAGEGLPKPADE